MKKSVFIIGLTILVCIVCLVGTSLILLEAQNRNVRSLGWEEDGYLWTVGMFGNVRWDVNQQTVVNRTFRPDAIDQIFVSQTGEVWGYGHGVWLFEEGGWTEVGEAGGLKRGVIYDMVQTSDGTIWVATWYGFKTWNAENRRWEPSIIERPGRILLQASDNSLWFGLTDEGVIRLQSDNLTHWTTSNGLIDNKVRSMLSASDGTIWVGTSDGISHWNGNSWQGWVDLGHPDADGLTVFKLLEASDGTIWADTSQDFARWKQGQWTTYKRDPFCGNSYSFLEADDGSLWAGCAIGLFRWAGSSWQEYDISEGIQDNSFARLVQGGNGMLYAHTKSGLYQYIPQQDRWQPFPGQQTLLERLIFFR